MIAGQNSAGAEHHCGMRETSRSDFDSARFAIDKHIFLHVRCPIYPAVGREEDKMSRPDEGIYLKWRLKAEREAILQAAEINA